MYTTLETSKTLKDWGVSLESEMWWEEAENPAGQICYDLSDDHSTQDEILNTYPAYDTEDLLKLLPAGHTSLSKIYNIDTGLVEYKANWVKGEDFYNTFAKTPTEALGELVLYLLKNKLLAL